MSAPSRVVTLPPTARGADALRFAEQARAGGADLLEIRTDLHGPEAVDLAPLARVLKLLVSERGACPPAGWLQLAARADVDLSSDRLLSMEGALVSHHASRALSTGEALERWSKPLPPGAHVKHVEPLEKAGRLAELLATQAALIERFGEGRVTVLCMGPDALPQRALLARRNALDYVALGAAWSAAPGQRLLSDAVREARSTPTVLRRGILGTGIVHSRSPRIHPQPFDRIDLPQDAQVEALVDALLPHYAGFAVTSPFKQRLARHVGSPLSAINTLVREGDRWAAFNTDVDGARVVLERLGTKRAFVLGDGGATAALKSVADARGGALRILRRAEIEAPLSGTGIWTWPDRVSPPESLRFRGARVAVIAYGAPGRRIAEEIRRRGGEPLLYGAAWFIAQARRQRAHWENAR